MLPINNCSADEYFDIFDQVVTQAVSGLKTLEQDQMLDENTTRIAGSLVRRGLSLASSICILWKAQNGRHKISEIVKHYTECWWRDSCTWATSLRPTGSRISPNSHKPSNTVALTKYWDVPLPGRN